MAAKSGKTAKTELVSIRLEHDLLRQLDALAEDFSRLGQQITRTDAVRIAILTGLDYFAKKAKRRK